MEETLKDHSKLLEMGGRMLSHVVGEKTTIQLIGEAADPPAHVANMVSAYISTPSGMKTFNIDHVPRSKHDELMGVKNEEIGRLKEKMDLLGSKQLVVVPFGNQEQPSEREKALIAENESLRRCKAELEEKTIRLESRCSDKQKEFETLHENIRILKEESSYESVKAAHKKVQQFEQRLCTFGKAMDVVLRHTSADFSNAEFPEVLYAYSQGLRKRARNPPNLGPFVGFPAHRGDESEEEDEDLRGIDDSVASVPASARCGTPVPVSTSKQTTDCSGVRSRPSSRASHASSSKKPKHSREAAGSLADHAEFMIRNRH
jgi:hypothetical protein